MRFSLPRTNRLEDHPMTCKQIGAPSLISHGKAIWKGNVAPGLEDLLGGSPYLGN